MSQEKYIMAIDQGTTVLVPSFSTKRRKVSSESKEFTQIFPQAGWVEHNANEIWNSVQSVIAGALSKVVSNQVKSKQSELPTNVKQLSSGIRKQDSHLQCYRLAITPNSSSG